MMARVLDWHIVITPGVAGGKPRIAGHRLTVQNIVIWHEQMGTSVAEICAESALPLAEVSAALAYAVDHRDAIDQCVANSHAWSQALRQRSASRHEQKRKARRGK